MTTRELLIKYTDSLKKYTAKTGIILGNDTRESYKFVDKFLESYNKSKEPEFDFAEHLMSFFNKK